MCTTSNFVIFILVLFIRENEKPGKLQQQVLSECLSLASIQSAELQDKVDEMCNVFAAVVRENRTLVNSGVPIVYLNSEHQVFNLFLYSLPHIYMPKLYDYHCQ